MRCGRGVGSLLLLINKRSERVVNLCAGANKNRLKKRVDGRGRVLTLARAPDLGVVKNLIKVRLAPGVENPRPYY